MVYNKRHIKKIKNFKYFSNSKSKETEGITFSKIQGNKCFKGKNNAKDISV